MRCPFCGNDDTQVKDSRPSDDCASIRRRRACPSCGARFTTFERVQLRDMIVIKADGRKQHFDREKIIKSMRTALRKRPVTEDQIDKAANSIARQMETMGETEVASKDVGAFVMKALVQLDMVGYVRYASVYKDFRAPEDFNDFVEELKELQIRKDDRHEDAA